MNTTTRSDDPKLVMAIIVIPAVAVVIFLTGALLVGQMVVEHGFSSSQAGYVISIELVGMALATLPAYYWLYRVDTSKAVRVSLLAVAVLNGLTVGVTLDQADAQALMVLRFLTGIPCGSLMVICLKTIAQLNHVDRGYSLHTLGQLLAYSISAALLPHFFALTGLYIAYALFGLAALAALPMARRFPRLCHENTAALNTSSGVNWLGLCSLLAVLLFYIALCGLWTYVERIGATSGISSTAIGYVLSLTALLGMVGAGGAAWLSGRVRSLPVVFTGIALMTLSVWMFIGPQTLTHYIAAASIAKLTWTFVLPFMLGVIALIDYSGRLITNLFMVVAVGLAAGPAIAAMLIGPEANYDRAVIVFSWTIGASLVLFTFVAYQAQKRQVRSNVDAYSPEERLA